MSRPPRPSHLPLRDGVSASCVVVRPGDAPTALDFLAARLAVLSRDEWAERLARGEVLDAQGQPLNASTPCRPGQRIFYYRRLAAEPEPLASEHIVFQYEWLVVADKPHFMPVTPGGRFVQRSLLVRLRQRLGITTLSPLHRIDRETAGLVAFAVQPHTRDAYQALFRDRAMHKSYEAVAPVRADLAFPREHHSRMEESQRFFLMHEVPGAPNSHTLMDVVQSNGHWARYSLQPISGKRHQLRVHMAALGIAIRNDAFYPEVNDPPEGDFSRPLQLLAKELGFVDPVSGVQHAFTSRLQLLPLPEQA